MNTLTCERVMILLPIYLEGKTSEFENYEIEKHLTECPECMEKYSTLQAISQKIKTSFDSVENQHFEKEKKFFKENLCAYLDNELSNEDYCLMTQIILENEESKNEIGKMAEFDKHFQAALEENTLFFQQNFCPDVIQQVKKDSPEYQYKMYVKAAVTTVVFISLTLLIGYFSSQKYFDDFQKMTTFSFSMSNLR